VRGGDEVNFILGSIIGPRHEHGPSEVLDSLLQPQAHVRAAVHDVEIRDLFLDGPPGVFGVLAVLALLVHVDRIEESDVVAAESHGALRVVGDAVLAYREHVCTRQLLKPTREPHVQLNEARAVYFFV